MRQPVIDLVINGRFLAQATTGVQRVARELTREFDRMLEEGENRFRIRLLHPPGADPSDLDLHRIAAERVEGPGGARWEQWALPRAVGGRHLLCMGNTAPVRSLVAGAPVSVMVHDLSYRHFPQAYRRRYRLFHAALLPLMLRRAGLIVTVSETERAALERIAPAAARKVVVARNGGWRDRGGEAEKPTPSGLEPGYLLYVGSLSSRKNVQGMIRAAARLAEADELRLVIAGSSGGVLAPVRVDPVDVGRAHVRMLGQVENASALAGLYRGAACLLFPSFYEASPLPPIEAMRFGVPVVASDLPSMRERCGHAAEYCDPSDTGSIAAAIRRVTFDPERRAELVAKGLEHAGRSSWRAQAQTILDAIAVMKAGDHRR